MATPVSLLNPESDPLAFADERIVLDPTTHSAVIDDAKRNDLNLTDLNLLWVFASNLEKEVTDSFIRQEVGYSASIKEHAIKVALSRLRSKLGPELGDPLTGAIQTEPRQGYYRSVSSLDNTKRWQDGFIFTFADERVGVNRSKRLIRRDGEIISHVSNGPYRLIDTLGYKPGKVFSIERLYRVLVGVPEGRLPKSWETSVRVNVNKARGVLGPELGDAGTGAIRTLKFLGYAAVESLSG
jgi:DNA-binding response OmpR family regulator